MQVKKQQLEPDKEQQTCFKLGKEYIKAVYFHPAYLTYIQSEVKSLSRVRLFSTPWILAYQGSPSMGFSRQEYWSGLPFPSPVIKYEVSEVKSLSRVQLFSTPWILAYQAPPSMGFSRQEYWNGLPFPSPHS